MYEVELTNLSDPKKAAARVRFSSGEWEKGKLVRGRSYERQTRDEIKFLSRVKPEDADFFPKLIEYGTYCDKRGRKFDWLLQERIKWASRRKKAPNWVLHLLQCVADKYRVGDLRTYCYDWWESSCNWGLAHDGRPVIYDTGVYY